MRYLVKRLPAFSVLFLLLVAFESRAQEVLTIRSGAISHTGNGALTAFTPYSFNFAGDGITVRGGDERGASVGMSCNPCAPGETLRLSVTINRFFTAAHGLATVNTLTYYPVWFLGSEFRLSLAPVTIPNTGTLNELTTRFTMSGNLIGYPFPSPFPLFNRAVEGQGVARITFVKSTFPDRPGYMFYRVSYKFEARRASSRKESSQPSRPSPFAQQ